MHEKIQQLEASGEIVGRQLLGIQSQFQFKRSPDIHDLSSLKERNGMLFYAQYSVIRVFIVTKLTSGTVEPLIFNLGITESLGQPT